MSLLNDLQKEQEKVFSEEVKKYAEEIVPHLKESAAKGYLAWEKQIKNDDERKHILLNSNFPNELEKHLEGLDVYVDHRKFKDFIFKEERTKRYLVVSWKEKEREDVNRRD